jgi:hypothetical protein
MVIPWRSGAFRPDHSSGVEKADVRNRCLRHGPVGSYEERVVEAVAAREPRVVGLFGGEMLEVGVGSLIADRLQPLRRRHAGGFFNGHHHGGVIVCLEDVDADGCVLDFA